MVRAPLLAGVLCGAALITLLGCARKEATTPVHGDGTENTEWPFAAWASARAYTYNFVPMNRHDPMTVYKGAARNPKVRSEHRISRAQTTIVLERVRALKGTFMVSKCPFPRHAVVYFSGSGEPVGEVDVCFECGDVIAVPDYPRSFEERYLALESYAASKAIMADMKRKVDREIGSDADYKKVLYDVPAKAWSEWITDCKTSKSDYEAAWAVERALFAPRSGDAKSRPGYPVEVYKTKKMRPVVNIGSAL